MIFTQLQNGIDLTSIDWTAVGLVGSLIANLLLLVWKTSVSAQQSKNQRQDDNVDKLRAKQERDVEKLERQIEAINSNIDKKLSAIMDGITDLQKSQAKDSQRTQEAFNKISGIIRDVESLEVDVKELREKVARLEQKVV